MTGARTDRLSVYLPAVRAIRMGHPLAVEHPSDQLPDLDFGPLINAAKAKEPADQVTKAIDRGAVPLHHGALVATLSCDDPATYARLAPQIRAFKTGHGTPRSRGDRDELFGGFGASWRGAFIGGDLLIRAVTEGPHPERLPGNFPDYHLMPN